MIKSAESTAKNTSKNSEKSEKNHPLKSKPFFAIPRHVAMIPGLTDRLFRLMSILCAAYGEDGHVEFKIRTLAALLQKGERQTKDLIKDARKKGLVTTKETGRSLVFFLGDICFEGGPKEVRKPARQVGGNPHTSYHLEKKPEKDEELSNRPPLSGADLVCFLLTTKQRQTVSKVLVNSVGKYIPDKEIPALIQTAFEKPDPCGYMWGAVRKKQKTDTQPRQYQTKPPSGQAPPAKPQKDMAEQGKISCEASAKVYHEEVSTKMETYLQEYQKAPEHYKKIVYGRILPKIKFPETRDKIIEKGPERLHEVSGIALHIKMAMGKYVT